MVRRENHINYLRSSLFALKLKCVFSKFIFSEAEKKNRDQTQWCYDKLTISSSLLRYSFSVPPKLDLRVCPKLGEREVTFYHVTEWIEKKLKDEFQVKKKKMELPNSVRYHVCFNLFFTFLPFQKVFVLPNMDDIYLPLMHSGVDCPQAEQCQSSLCPCSQSSSAESMQRNPAESD